MTLPAHENTWVFDVNGRESIVTGGTDEAAAAELILHYKQALTGSVRHGHSGSFSLAGTTITFTATEQGGFPRSGFTSNLVGKTIETVGATTGGNNGYFVITAVTSTTTLTYENASGATEAFTGSYRITSDIWTALPNGRSPWKCKGSGAGSTGKGAAMDGVDRWVTSGDLQSSTSPTGDRSWFVFENEQSGAELCVFHFTNSASSDFERAEWVASPIQGFSGGATNARPTATDEVVVNTTANHWLGQTPVNDRQWNFYLLMTDDGLQTMMWMSQDQVEKNLLVSRLPSDVVDDSVIPWNGTRNIMGFSAPLNLNAMTFSHWNDTACLWATIDKDGSAGGLYRSSFRISTAMMINNTVAQHLSNYPQQITQEWHAASLRLECTTSGVQGSHGRLSDWFFVGENETAGMPQGAGMPGDTSRIYIRIADFIVPWNGTVYRR